jgi:hypothetical protein
MIFRKVKGITLERGKKGTGYFSWKGEECLYSWTVHTKKVACPLFKLEFFWDIINI